ncbi:UDP-N-acetylmuramate dehydrogenase [Brevibacillus daliensis]|uniref:UDP-N-acetylmuramate dehydrogenase n=1 Tax=Brevibacillus daliensis TaxID=2892995 RepID=UPI001E4B8ACB|nr:UDP-N-acetylmuramate dehydrogenase [Brevibacillus daliensis]
MNQKHIIQDIEKIITVGIAKINEPLKTYTHTKTGGKADIFVQPGSYEEVQGVVQYARKNEIPVTILGNGSNVIVRDGGIRGIVLHLVRLDTITVTDQKIVARCGAAIIDVSRVALRNSLTGLEFACGIPGTVGGALYMNAGAYGGEVAHVLQSALVLTSEGELLRMGPDDFQFGYRRSAFADQKATVLEATFQLILGDQALIQEKMNDLTFQRESKQPLEYPSCGSVFKRPPNHFAGKLIQDSGLQKTRIGGAEISEKHAGFIINVDQATATDYLNLIKHVQQTVKAKYNVDLETEVKILGEDE